MHCPNSSTWSSLAPVFRLLIPLWSTLCSLMNYRCDRCLTAASSTPGIGAGLCSTAGPWVGRESPTVPGIVGRCPQCWATVASSGGARLGRETPSQRVCGEGRPPFPSSPPRLYKTCSVPTTETEAAKTKEGTHYSFIFSLDKFFI